MRRRPTLGRGPGPRGAPSRREPASPFVTVRQAFAIGLVCFALWLFLDARQLYQNAVGSPLGTRRSVSLAILKPIARVEDAFGVDRLVNGANRLIGKGGSPGGSTRTVVSPTTLPVATRPTTVPNRRGVTTTLPAVASPTKAHPFTILDIGDSIGEDLGIGLASRVGGLPDVHLYANSVGDTGLSNLGYFDWLAQLPVELAKDHPDAVVVMLGANDAQSFQDGSAVYQVGTAGWRRVYTRRVNELMTEATRSGARLIWVGLPIMGPTSGLSNTQMQVQNAIYENAARHHPGVTYVSTWTLFQDASGAYATYLTGPGGGLVEVRTPDEVHVDPPGGTDILGRFVVKRMESTWHITF